MNIQPLNPQSAGITGPMNINAVIAHLIEMTPGQRKQFAQIHMEDPMMLSAAKFVDNQVSKQAQSLAAQQTGAAPPPVNQQAVAQMSGAPMPEDTGIAQLPAENMPAEYAGGGIVAFADRGLVDTSPQYTGVGGGQGRRGMPVERAPVVQSPAPRAQVAPAAYKEVPYVSPQSAGLETLLKGYQESQGPAEDPFAAQRAESGRARDKIAQEEMAGVLEREKGIGTLLKGKEARIAGREERLNQQEGMDLNMSIINAGLAMMQSTGKGLAGIAEGAQKGVGQFTESLKLNEASRQKIEDARDAHDDLRFNLNNMSSKEKQAARRAIEEAKIITTTESINALEKNYGLKRADATALFGAKVNQIAAAENRDFQGYEAAKGREFTALQTDKQMAHAEKLNALSIAASAGNAAASRDLQREIAKMPSKEQELYKSLSPTGNIREGFKFAMEQRQAGGEDKAELAAAIKILEDPMIQMKQPELWKAAQDRVKSTFAPTVNVPQANMRSRP